MGDWVEDRLHDISDSVKGLWDSVRNIAEFLVSGIFDALETSLKILFRDVLAPVFKPIFHILGIDGETIYSIEVITIPLIDKESKFLKTMLLDSIVSNTSLSTNLLVGMHTSQKATLAKYFRYGETSYFNGVPEVTMSEYFTDTEVVVDVLETIEGETLEIGSVSFSNPDWGLWCKDYLMDNNSYVIETNILTDSSVDWYFDNVELNGAEDAFIVNLTRDTNVNVEITDYAQILLDPTEFTDTWTERVTTTTFTPSDTPIQTTLTTNYTRAPTTTGGPYLTYSTLISDVDTPGTDTDVLGAEVDIYNDGGYYGVVYFLDSSTTVGKIWFYEVALGTYPELHNELIGGPTDGLGTLPIVELRRDFVNIDDDTESEAYLTTEGILRILNIVTLDNLLESFTDIPEGEGDINLIQDAYLVFGVNLYTEDQRSLRYLYAFFVTLGELPRFSKTEFNALTAADKSNANFIYTVKEAAYNTTISGNYIDITEVVGVIGIIGYAESAFTITANTEAAESNIFIRTDPVLAQPTDSLGLVNSVFTIRLQLTATTYSQIEVSGLVLTTLIITTGTSVGVKAIELVDPVTGSDEDKANFIIPLNNFLLKNVPFLDAEQIIYDACHLVIYAEEVTDLAYYETTEFSDLFGIIIDLVSIVFLVLSVGTATPLIKSIQLIAKQLLIQYGLTKLLTEILSHGLSDSEKVAVLFLYVIATKKLAGLAGTASFTLLADQILLSVNSITTFMQIDTQNKTQELLEEQAEFETLVTEWEEELQAAQDWLTPEGGIDTFNLLNSRILPVFDTDITPTEFYAKSLLTNVAPLIYAQTSSYVSSVLDLNNIRTDFTRNTSTEIDQLL